MIYRVGRWWLRLGVHQFFRSIYQRGAPPIEAGPLIVVPNHPNHLLDALMIIESFERPLWFLGKSTLFKGPLKYILPRLHLLPIYRRQDNPEEMQKNAETFRSAIDNLKKGRALVLFPEGVSWGERKLYPIKTGAARIALQAEAQNRFGLGVRIQPVGLTYSELKNFRASVTVTMGEPIEVRSLKAVYEADPRGTVEQLTSKIEQALKEVTVEVQAVEYRDLVEQIARLYELRESTIDDRARFELIARNVQAVLPENPIKGDELQKRLAFFFELTRAFSLDGHKLDRSSTDRCFWLLATLLVVCGFLVFFLPYKAVGILVERFSTHPADTASLKFSLGCVLFPLWIFVLSALFAMLYNAPLFGFAISAIFLVGVAVVTNSYQGGVRLFLLALLWPGRSNPVQLLKVFRDQLIAELDALRVV